MTGVNTARKEQPHSVVQSPADGYYYIAATAEDAWTGTYELTVTVVTDE